MFLASILLMGIQIAVAAETAPSKAEALINEADASHLVFQVNSAGDVVHVQSGMTCVLGAAKFSLRKLIIISGHPAGDDVACDYATPQGTVTIFATKLNGMRLEAAAFDIFKAMRMSFPSGKLIKGPLVASYPGLSDPISASIEAPSPDGIILSSAWVAEAQGWLIEVRATYPKAEQHDTELVSAISSISARLAINRHDQKP